MTQELTETNHCVDDATPALGEAMAEFRKAFPIQKVWVDLDGKKLKYEFRFLQFAKSWMLVAWKLIRALNLPLTPSLETWARKNPAKGIMEIFQVDLVIELKP